MGTPTSSPAYWTRPDAQGRPGQPRDPRHRRREVRHIRTPEARQHRSGGGRPGQLLGRLGNSGNTTAPHLHFHVMDAPLALGADHNQPYVIDTFAYRVHDEDVLPPVLLRSGRAPARPKCEGRSLTPGKAPGKKPLHTILTIPAPEEKENEEHERARG